MVKYCCVKDCLNYEKPGSAVTFHPFPRDSNMLNLWSEAVKDYVPKYFKPSSQTLICSEHFHADHFTGTAQGKYLRTDAIPSFFKVTTNPNQKQYSNANKGVSQVPNAHPAPVSTSASYSFNVTPSNAANFTTNQNGINYSTQYLYQKPRQRFVDKASQTICPPSILELRMRSKIKTLRTQLRRRESKRRTLGVSLKQFKDRVNIENIVEENFSGFSLELFKNEVKNLRRLQLAQKHVYTKEIKDFARTLFLLSPKAYNYVQEKICLPHQDIVKRWLLTGNCDD